MSQLWALNGVLLRFIRSILDPEIKGPSFLAHNYLIGTLDLRITELAPKDLAITAWSWPVIDPFLQGTGFRAYYPKP